jgi:DNA polymerase-3 subunit alpha
MADFLKTFKRYDIPNYGVRMPEVKIPEEEYDSRNLDKNISNIEFLDSLAREGFRLKIVSGEIDKSKSKEYADRFKYERAFLEEGGFIDYVLLVWQIINFCKKNDVPTGAARGSAAGSLVLYLIGVTEVDPIKYDLYFERFLSKARLKKKVIDGITYLDGGLVPDVDMDLGHEGREKVVNYLLSSYSNKSCKLSTLSTLSTRILIKECGKIVSEHSEQTMNEISSCIETVYGKPQSIDESIESNVHFAEFCEDNPKVIKIARKLQGLVKNKGSHASGYLVSYYNLDKNIPLEIDSHGETVSCYDMRDAQEIAIKIDLLGLQDVTLINNICKSI